jgi:SAM-dependent methyltransferase
MGRQDFLRRAPGWLSSRVDVDHREILALMDLAQRTLRDQALVLDAGAGEGRYRHFFSHTRRVGLDFAKGDTTWDYSGLDVISDLGRIPAANDTFDAAICTQVLEHVQEPKAVLQEISRVVHPGGHLFLSVPQWWFQHQKPHDYFRYTSFGLLHLFEQAAFDVVFVKPMGGYFWFLSVVLQGLHAHLFPDRGPRWLRWLMRVPRLLTQMVFWSIVPVVLFYLDRLDTERDFTLGYVCHCVKK